MFSRCFLENFKTFLWRTSHAVIAYAMQVNESGDFEATFTAVKQSYDQTL